VAEGNDPALIDPDADVDYDGLTNFTEYAFGENPAAPAGNPVAFLSSTSSPTLTYTRRKPSLTDLTYSVWTSTDLNEWTEDTGASLIATAISGTDNESVEVTLSPERLGTDRLFVRIMAA
jgi:hypothetical protein